MLSLSSYALKTCGIKAITDLQVWGQRHLIMDQDGVTLGKEPAASAAIVISIVCCIGMISSFLRGSEKSNGLSLRWGFC